MVDESVASFPGAVGAGFAWSRSLTNRSKLRPYMLQFLVRRLIVAILVAATVMTLAFILTRLSGDLAISIAGPNATQADVEAVRLAYGLNRPLSVQFFDWVRRAATGDLGESYFFKVPVATLIGERMPITIT